MNVRNLSFLLLFFAVISQAFAQDCNLVYNGDFSDARRGWVRYNQEGGESSWELDTLNNLHFKVQKAGRKVYSIQIIAPDVMLEQGETYLISLRARAGEEGSFRTAVSMNHTPWTSFMIQDFPISTQDSLYQFEFVMEAETDPHARIEINIGGESDIKDFWLSGASVVNVACANGTKERVTENELILAEIERRKNGPKLPKVIYKEGFMPIAATGYIRMNTVYRNLNESYLEEPYAPKDFIINGVYPDNPISTGFETGYREPLMMLQLKGKPTPNTDFNVDFVLDNQMIGELGDESRRFETYRFLNMGGEARTKVGTFKLELGGVNFVRMSPFTLWRYEYRDDMFERYPWEWNRASFPRYDEYYNSAAVGRDSRFSSTALQGVVLKAKGLPKRFSLLTAYGKTNNTINGFLSFLNNNYKYIFAQQLGKQFGRHSLNLNFYNQRGYIDNIRPNEDVSNLEDEKVVSVSGNLSFKTWRVTGELGAGSFVNPDVTEPNWTPALLTKAYFPELVPGFPISMQAYHVGRDFLNPNSTVMNTLLYGGGEFGLEFQYLNINYRGGVAELGQIANNRQGIDLFVSKVIKNLKLDVGYGLSQEIVFDADSLTFQHRAAALNRSRFIFYRSEAGPYNRLTNTWRRSYEVLTLGDSTNSNFKKGFQTLDLSLKHKGKIGEKSFIFSAYANINTVTDGFSPLLVFSEEAFLRNVFQEYQIFLGMSERVTWVGQVAFERSRGNQLTNLAENGLPIDQRGTSYGIGLDLDFKNSGLYLRQKWYEHRDDNFELDHFQGWETTVELKAFF